MVGDELRFEYPLLKAPVVVPVARVEAVVRPLTADWDLPLLKRDPRLLNLNGGLLDPNVVLIFRSPVRVGRLKFGAEQGLAISRKERRDGLDVDGLGVTVEDPDGLAEAIQRRGVRSAPRVEAALVDVIGEATGDEVEPRRREVAWDRRKGKLYLGAFGLASAIMLALKWSENATAAATAGLVLSAVGWAAFIALLISSIGLGRSGPKVLRDRDRRSDVLLRLIAVAAFIFLPALIANWLSAHLGTPRQIADGLVAGLPGGVLIGYMLRTAAS